MTDQEQVWLLRLNDMRAAQIEILDTVAVASSREALEQFVHSEAVPDYTTDQRWHKVFREGGPLEWCNPPMSDDGHYVCLGTRAEWLEAAGRNFDRFATSAPRVGP